jgi:hypothetical protein
MPATFFGLPAALSVLSISLIFMEMGAFAFFRIRLSEIMEVVKPA